MGEPWNNHLLDIISDVVPRLALLWCMGWQLWCEVSWLHGCHYGQCLDIFEVLDDFPPISLP